jgi:putative methyltransferase (TIGR04325 family)
MKSPIWEGVYNRFQDAPVAGPGFEDKIWIKKSLKKAESLRDVKKEDPPVPKVTKNRETLLAVVAGIVYGVKGRVKILDFGGGMGFAWYPVVRGIPRAEDIELHIVENEKTCQAGGVFFEKESNIFFHGSLPEADEGDFDIVHMGSSLQYIEHWEKLLAHLCGYRPQYFMLSDLPAGKFPSYISVQNSYGSLIPHWFFNEDEIIMAMARQGFKPVFRSTYIPEILGKLQPYPQDNFKQEHRLGYPIILLFTREGP